MEKVFEWLQRALQTVQPQSFESEGTVYGGAQVATILEEVLPLPPEVLARA
jgi:hypothetical protein